MRNYIKAIFLLSFSLCILFLYEDMLIPSLVLVIISTVSIMFLVFDHLGVFHR